MRTRVHVAALLSLGSILSTNAFAEVAAPDPNSPVPKPVLPPPAKLQFMADPIADGAVLSLALGVGGMSEAILATGEITPQKPNSSANFLGIDEASIGKRPIAGWGTVSNVGLFSAFLFAAADPIATGFRDNPQAGIVDGVIYAETLSTMWALTNVTKIAFRRPRPSAYAEQARLDEACAGQPPGTCVTPSISETDSTASFFSGHAAATAAVFTTATYLAFARSPGTIRPWLTLALGAAVTTLTDIGRVQAGKHFPTDVIAGSLAGLGVGIIVPHMHRTDSMTRRPVWVGFEPRPGGGAVTLNAVSF
jgi:membrane-associated phospholipid phosphatase